MNKLVSIIVPFYNSAATIDETIKSLRSQTYQDIEFVFVNDGSSDETKNIIIGGFGSDNRFKIIDIPNSGPAFARIIGLRESRGDYVFFLDSDDLLHPSAIELCLQTALKTNSDVVIAKYNTFITKFDVFSPSIKTASELLVHDELMSELASCNRIQNFIWGKLFKRSILFEEDFDRTKLLGEDISTMFKIFERCKCGTYLSGDSLVFYRQSELSLSRTHSYAKLNDYCNALIEKTSFIKEKYPSFYHLTFAANIDFWFLIEVNYDMSRIKNSRSLYKHIRSSCTGSKNRMKLFIANHPFFARKLITPIHKDNSSLKKKIAVINTYNKMSTGNIAKAISDGVSGEFNTKLFYGRCKDKWDNDSIYVGGAKICNFLNNIYVKLSGKIGGAHKRATKRLIKELKKFNPDIIHLHNIHGNFLNYKILFEYLEDKPVIVTMHDCFWLTGRCAHFIDMNIECNGWKSGCQKCNYKHLYMGTLVFDRASKIYKTKKDFLEKKNDIYLVALSEWQRRLFDKKDVYLIPNGFDFNVNTDGTNSNANSKINIIGVAQNWVKSKGVEDFNYLVKNLDFNKFNITLIGNKPRKVKIDNNINFLGNLSNEKTLELIKNSDVFVNPTYVDTFPTVLIESLSCGTPIITYDVGGCKDIVGDCGQLISSGDKESLLNVINSFSKNDLNRERIIKRSKLFDKKTMIGGYLKLYMRALHGKG